MSVTVTTIHNPFQEWNNCIEEKDFCEGKMLDYYLPEIKLYEEMRLVVAINGGEVTGDYNSCSVNDNDIIAVGVATEGTMATAIAAWATSSMTVGAALTTVAYAAVYMVSYVAIMGVMSLLATALGPGGDSGGGGETDIEQTYGWGSLAPSLSEGNPIPIAFGRNKFAGQVINEFIEVKNNDQYLYSLMALCDHELDSITDIKINNQPASYYQAVTTDIRLGTLTDTAIDGFNEIVEQKNYGDTLDQNVEVIKQTDGNSVEKINVCIIAPRGIYYTNKKGRLVSLTASFEIKYRIVGETTWIDLEPIPHIISAVTTEAVRRTYTIDDLTPAQYEISVRRTNASSPTSLGTSEIELASIQEVVKESLTYPGLAKYSVQALATGQLSGARPTYTCIGDKSTVQVHNGTAWVSKSADNPAWICYAILNLYVPYGRIIYDEFQSWADFCSQDVNDDPAITEKRYVFATVTNQNMSLWDKVQEIARYAQAVIVPKATRYGVFVDKQETIVSHLFGLGNIKENSFSIQYLPLKDRANAVEIEYTDPDKDYTRHVVTVMSADYNTSDSLSKKATIHVKGSIPYNQAVRMGIKQINDNKYITRIVTFEADIDSFACVMGDLVYCVVGASGRIVSATSNTVTLDRQVVIEAGQVYKILLRLSDNTIVEKGITNTAGTYTTLTTDSNFSTVPAELDVYAFGIATTVKKVYRIINITKADDFTRTLTCLEYIDEIYTENDGMIIEEPPWEQQIQEAVNVRLREVLVYNTDGTYGSNIRVSWHPAYSVQAKQWAVWLRDKSTEQDAVKIAEVSNLNHIIPASYLVAEHEYRVTICRAGDGLYESDNADDNNNFADITLQGKLAPPSDVENFTGQFNSLVRTVNLSWSAITDIDLKHYEIREKTTGTPGWDAATLAGKTINSSISFVVDNGTDETKTYYIKAFDTSEIYSENAGETGVAIDTSETPLSPVTGLTVTSDASFTGSGEQIITMTISWDENLSDDFFQYQIRIERQIGSNPAGHAMNPIVGFSTVENQYDYIALPATKYWVSVRAVDTASGSTAWCSQVEHITAIDSIAPADPTGLTATGLYSSIIVKAYHSGEADLHHFDVYRHTSNASGSAVVVGTANFTKTGNFAIYNDVPPDDSEYFYWVRGIDSSGNASEFSNSDSASAPGMGIGDRSITSVMIGLYQILAPHILAGEIGADHIAANAITAMKIDVDELSAITANMGVIIAGIIQNAETNPTTWLDLTNNTMSLGNKFIWDGVQLLLNGWNNAADSTKIDGGKIHAGSRIQIGNTDGTSDYCLITNGELIFSRYFDETIGHQIVRSLKQIKYGSCVNDTTVTLDGYWANKPIIHVSPKEIMTFDVSQVLYSQKIRCPDPQAVEVTKGKWEFTPQAALVLSDGAASRQINISANNQAECIQIYAPSPVTTTTEEYTIIEANTRSMNLLIHAYGHAEQDGYYNPERDTHVTRTYYQIAGTLEVRVCENGAWTTWDDHGHVFFPLAAGLNAPVAINIDISATVDITKIQARLNFNGLYERVYKQPFAYHMAEVGDWHGSGNNGSTIFYCEVEIVSYQSELTGFSVLSEGELNYIAIEGNGDIEDDYKTEVIIAAEDLIVRAGTPREQGTIRGFAAAEIPEDHETITQPNENDIFIQYVE